MVHRSIPMPSKIEITKTIISQAKSDLTLEKAIWFWYTDGRKNSPNLRLTKDGYAAFLQASYQFYPIQLSENTEITWAKSKQFLDLQSKIKSPWYITPKHIYVSDQSEAAWLTLIGGELELLH